MLALSRKRGESIIINGNIQIKVLEYNGDQIKIGIEAPKDITIYRKELYDVIEEENNKALNSKLPKIK